MEQPIILLSGGTGVGTSRIAAELANRVGIYAVISTDAIREILRSAIVEGVNPALHTSTYLAGQSENYKIKSQTVRREKVLRGFKTQASAIAVGIHGLIERHLRENSPVIIEGVHIIPQDYESPLANRVMQYFIDIPNERVHRERLRIRSKEAPERKLQTYLDNFREIRWIQAHLRRKATEIADITTIDNGGTLDRSVDACVQAYWKRYHH